MSTRLFVLSLVPLMLLQACDGTTFGQRLSESFDAQSGTQTGAQSEAASKTFSQPDQDDAGSGGSDVADKNTQPASSINSDQAGTKDKAGINQNEKSTEASRQERPELSSTKGNGTDRATATDANSDSAATKAAPERTLPYRIMIRLSAADPAAPAEGVTEALRRAGIGFEVETIEKLPVRDLNQSSNPAPKPAS